MTQELKPCPFCGSARIGGGYIRDGWTTGCKECGANAIAFNPEAARKSAEKWNRRHDTERIKALEAALKPFADAVFNDNHDMSVSPVSDFEAYVRAYFAHRALIGGDA